MSEYLPLGECCNHILDFRGRTPLKLGMDWGGGNIPALSANNVKDGYIDFQKECNVGSDDLYRAWMTRGDCRKGDILFTMEAPMGNVAQVPDNGKYILSQRVILISPKSKVVCGNYLFHFLRSDEFRKQCDYLATGTTAKGIKQANLVGIEIPIPPLPEQKKIAEILSRIDHLIRREDECHDAMSSLLQSHLRSQRFSNGESIAISDACLLVADCMHKTPVFEETGFPIVRTPNVRDGMLVHEGMKFISEESYREWIQKDKPEPGDILFTREAPLGEACLVPKDFPLCIGQRMMLLRANPRILSPEFLLFRLRSLATQQKLQLLSGGSTVGHANVKDIRNLEIEIPNESEQRIAISIYESISCCIDKHATKKQKLLHLKQALATDLLSGRKRVSI